MLQQRMFDEARELFPGICDKVYLDVAGRGLMSLAVSDALEKHFQELRSGTVDKAEYFVTIARVREKFATLINAHPDEVAYTKNVSDGLNAISSAMDWHRGDSVILCTELEHPNNVYPWLNIRDRFGVEVRTIPNRLSSIDVSGIVNAIDDTTRLVTVSSVTFAPGKRADIETLGNVCRARGVFLLVDAAQAVGVLHTDVKRMKVDGLVVATQKALLGLYGMGFMYCRRECAERLRPAALARFGVTFGSGMHEASTGSGLEYSLMPGARRFDIGNYNYPAVYAVEQSLDLLMRIGTERIDNYVCELAKCLSNGLESLGIPVCSSKTGPELSHIVTAGYYCQDSNNSVTDPEIAAIAKYLQDNHVVFSIRRGLMRFAFHLYNNKADIEKVLSLIADWRSNNA